MQKYRHLPSEVKIFLLFISLHGSPTYFYTLAHLCKGFYYIEGEHSFFQWVFRHLAHVYMQYLHVQLNIMEILLLC